MLHVAIMTHASDIHVCLFFFIGQQEVSVCFPHDKRSRIYFLVSNVFLCLHLQWQVHLSLSLPLYPSPSLTLSTSLVAFYNKLASLLVVFERSRNLTVSVWFRELRSVMFIHKDPALLDWHVVKALGSQLLFPLHQNTPSTLSSTNIFG